MGSKIIILFNSLLYLSIIFGSPPQVSGQETQVECVDNLSDFQNNKWTATSTGLLQYAETSEQLPEPLKGKLAGDGILYFKSIGSSDIGQGVAKLDSNINSTVEPYFLYLKYYTHITSLRDQEIVAYPELVNHYGYLDLTSNFEWGEVIVQIDPFNPNTLDFIGTWVWFFDVDEYLLIDQIILAQGFPSLDVQGIKSLCGYDEQPPTTTTTTEVTTTTEEADDPTTSTTEEEVDPTTTTTTEADEPTTTTTEQEEPTTTTTTTTTAPPFPCRGVGYFADPLDCTRYHWCRRNDVGDLYDTVLQCDSGKVWCKERVQCESESTCPCSIFY